MLLNCGSHDFQSTKKQHIICRKLRKMNSTWSPLHHWERQGHQWDSRHEPTPLRTGKSSSLSRSKQILITNYCWIFDHSTTPIQSNINRSLESQISTLAQEHFLSSAVKKQEAFKDATAERISGVCAYIYERYSAPRQHFLLNNKDCLIQWIYTISQFVLLKWWYYLKWYN